MTTWVALESNPDVLNKYIHKLGVPSRFELIDVYSLDEEALEWIPQPVKALILLFPCSDAYEAKCAKDDAETLKKSPPSHPRTLFFLKQLIRNACGAIALTHAILNNSDIELAEGSILRNYLEKARDLTPEERGKVLEEDAVFTEAHQAIGVEGQTAPPEEDEEVDHHFVALVHKEGELFKLDGCRAFPIKHGATSKDLFLTDGARVCREVIARTPDDIRFNILALVEMMD